MDKETLLKGFGEFLEKHFQGSSKEQVEITKAVDEEERLALFVVLEPDTYDLHDHIYSSEEVWKACVNFNQHCMKANLFHLVETEDMEIVQSFINPSDFTMDNGKEIKKGTWLAWTYFPETEAGDGLWEGVKKGSFNGLSIQCRAFVEDINDE